MPACPEAPTRRGTQSKLTRRLGDRMHSCRHQGGWRTAVSERHWETRAAFSGRSGSGQPRGLAPSSPCPLPPRASRPSPLPQLPRSLATCRDGIRPSTPAGLRPRPPPPRSPPGQHLQEAAGLGVGGVSASFTVPWRRSGGAFCVAIRPFSTKERGRDRVTSGLVPVDGSVGTGRGWGRGTEHARRGGRVGPAPCPPGAPGGILSSLLAHPGGTSVPGPGFLGLSGQSTAVPQGDGEGQHRACSPSSYLSIHLGSMEPLQGS